MSPVKKKSGGSAKESSSSGSSLSGSSSGSSSSSKLGARSTTESAYSRKRKLNEDLIVQPPPSHPLRKIPNGTPVNSKPKKDSNASKGSRKNSKKYSGDSTRSSGSKKRSGDSTRSSGSKKYSGDSTRSSRSKKPSGESTRRSGSKKYSGDSTRSSRSKKRSGDSTRSSRSKKPSGESTRSSRSKKPSGESTRSSGSRRRSGSSNGSESSDNSGSSRGSYRRSREEAHHRHTNDFHHNKTRHSDQANRNKNEAMSPNTKHIDVAVSIKKPTAAAAAPVDGGCGPVRNTSGCHQLQCHRSMEEAGRYFYAGYPPPIQVFCNTPAFPQPRYGIPMQPPCKQNIQQDNCHQGAPAPVKSSVHVLYDKSRAEDMASREHHHHHTNKRHHGHKHRHSHAREDDADDSSTVPTRIGVNVRVGTSEFGQNAQSDSNLHQQPSCYGGQCEQQKPSGVALSVAVSSKRSAAESSLIPMESSPLIESEYIEPLLRRQTRSEMIINGTWVPTEDDDVSINWDDDLRGSLHDSLHSVTSSVGVSNRKISYPEERQSTDQRVSFSPSVHQSDGRTVSVNVTVSSGGIEASEGAEDAKDMEQEILSEDSEEPNVETSTEVAEEGTTVTVRVSSGRPLQDEEEMCGSPRQSQSAPNLSGAPTRVPCAAKSKTHVGTHASSPSTHFIQRPSGSYASAPSTVVVQSRGTSSVDVRLFMEIVPSADLPPPRPTRYATTSDSHYYSQTNVRLPSAASSRGHLPTARASSHGASTSTNDIKIFVDVQVSANPMEDKMDRSTGPSKSNLQAPVVQCIPPPQRSVVVAPPPRRLPIAPRRRNKRRSRKDSGCCSGLISELAKLLHEQKKVLQMYQRMACCCQSYPCMPPCCPGYPQQNCCMPWWAGGAGMLPLGCCNWPDSSSSDSSRSSSNEDFSDEEREMEEGLRLAEDIKHHPNSYGVGGVRDSGGDRNMGGRTLNPPGSQQAMFKISPSINRGTSEFEIILEVENVPSDELLD